MTEDTKRDLRTAALIYVVLQIVYAATRAQAHMYADDSIRWAIDVERGNLIHQHHGVYLYVGHLFFELLRALGVSDRSLLPLQILSATCGALGVAAFFLTMRRMGSQTMAALITSGTLAFTFGFWGYSVVADVYVPTTALLIVGAYHLVALLDDGPTFRRSTILAAIVVGAVAFHQAAILFYPVVLLGLFLAPRFQRSPWLHAVFVSVVAGVTILGGYVLLYRASQAGPLSFSGFQSFLTGYLTEMDMLPGDSGFSKVMLARASIGLSQAILSANVLFHWDSVYEAIQSSLPHKYLIDDRFLVRNLNPAEIATILVSFGAFATGIVMLFVSQARTLASSVKSRVFVLMGAWFLLQAGFFTWWEAGSNEFWISSLVPLLICLHRLVLSGPLHSKQLGWGITVGASLLVANYVGAILPAMDPANDYWMANKQYLGTVGNNDVVITYDSHTPRLSAQYFSNARIINLFPPPGEGIDEDALFETLDRTTAAGNRVYIDPRAWNPDRVTLAVNQFFNPEVATRFPTLLAEIVSKYADQVEFPPLRVRGPDDPAPLLQPPMPSID